MGGEERGRVKGERVKEIERGGGGGGEREGRRGGMEKGEYGREGG